MSNSQFYCILMLLFHIASMVAKSNTTMILDSFVAAVFAVCGLVALTKGE